MKRIFLKIFVLFSFIILGFYVYLINAWKVNFTEDELIPYIKEIKQAENLPIEFYRIYNLNYHNSLELSAEHYLFKTIIGLESSSPISFELSQMISIPNMNLRNRIDINRLIIQFSLATKIDDEITKKEQLNYIFKKADFVNGQIGVKNAAKFYFDKEIDQLNKNEIASFVVMLNNPSLYNPLRRPKKLEVRVKNLLAKDNY